MMQLYGPQMSNNVFRPLLVARHLGLPVELKAVALTEGEHRGPAFLALNPHGRIPVLVDDDYKLWESVAIMQYLAAQKPSPLWPDDVRARATITSWQCWSLKHLFGAVGPIQFERYIKGLFGRGEADEAVVASSMANFHTEMAVMEDRLKDARSDWLVGDGLTLADFCIAGAFLHAEPARLPMDDYPLVTAWLARVKALPAWAEAMKG